MQLVIIENTRHIEPFNEPASQLQVLNKTLAQWQLDLVGPLTQGRTTVPDFDAIPASGGERLVVADNLWFDGAFLNAFLERARSLGKPAQAAIQPDDPAYLQHGLDRLTQSYEKRSDLYYAPLWYFTGEVTRRVDPVVISSGARAVTQRFRPASSATDSGNLTWHLPQRAVCPVDTWVHLFFINNVFGIATRAAQFEQRMTSRGFQLRARWRSLIERKPALATSAYVRAGQNCSIDPGTVFRGPVYLGDNVTIGPGCVISQSIIGSNVTLAQGNHLHLSVIGDGCYFPWQANAIMSTFMPGSTGAQNSSIPNSVVGRDTRLGAGVIFSDTNLLPQPLQATFNYQSVDLALPTLGVCVGHNCRIGAGLIVNPALSIESDVVLLASSNRRAIMNNISYEESDHHALPDIADLHPRQYPRDYEQDQRSLESQW
jgi:acetyltransferase-like isoleucine patch superfamily enzyme